MPGYADFEPLLDDARVQQIASRVRSAFAQRGVPDDLIFLTFIQPATTTQHNGVVMPLPPVAVFAVLSENPRHTGFKLMTQGSAWLEQWRDEDARRKHFVSGPDDPALPIFKLVMLEHLKKLADLKELI